MCLICKNILRNAAFLITILLPIVLHGGQSLEESVRFCAVGHVLLDRGIRTRIQRHGTHYPFEKTAGLINSYDLAFCNLEGALSNQGSQVEKMYAFRGDSAFVDGLTFSGFNIYSLANNHTLDYGREAFLDTKHILQENGFSTVGAGRNQDEAFKAVILHVKDITLAFMASVIFPFEGITYAKELPGPALTDIDG